MTKRALDPLPKRKPLTAAIKAMLVPATVAVMMPVMAEEGSGVVEELLVTGTRRAVTVQDVPINIAAVSGELLEEQGLGDMTEVAAWVPGLHIVDQGSRGPNRIVVRGLNADPLESAEATTDGGGTVATYLGEIPIYLDLKLNDIERVEVLLGPQGTLYGAGTLGGAIRYIPNKPKFDDSSSYELRGDLFSYSEGSGLGSDIGITANFPISEKLALRASVDRLDDPGFIDYNYLVQEVGISNPNVDITDEAAVAANLRQKKDANTEEAISGRVALRYLPTENIDATLTYYFQNSDSGGRTINHVDSFGTGQYEAAHRVEEPNERENELFALEVVADLGFAELTSATGAGGYNEIGQRDQTDLLISLEYSYEAFPNFTAFTQETQDDDIINQEIRLVSTNDGPLSWIVGGFYNSFNSYSTSKEFVPEIDQFFVDEFGGIQLRPDSLEYFSVNETDLSESAFFGELGYQFTDAWQVTVGARRYDYDLTTRSAFDLPLLNTVFFGDPQDAIFLDFDESGQEDSGTLFKFNTSYQFNDDMLGYFTVSEGYRIGNSNGVAACPDPLPTNQIICALPNELQYFPDTTTNYEVGLRTTLLDGRMTLNGSLYYIDWSDPQLAATTENGLVSIVLNGEGAESKGFEMNFDATVTDNLSVRGNYAFNQAELSADAPDLITEINPPGFQSTVNNIDGLAGDRLPGSPEHQGSLFINYNRVLANGYDMDINYGLSAISDVLTITGERGGGEALAGYGINNASIDFSKDNWSVGLYAKNIFNKYAETGVRDTQRFVQSVSDIDGAEVKARRYYKNVLTPRQIGLRFNWEFGGE